MPAHIRESFVLGKRIEREHLVVVPAQGHQQRAPFLPEGTGAGQTANSRSSGRASLPAYQPARPCREDQESALRLLLIAVFFFLLIAVLQTQKHLIWTAMAFWTASGHP